MTQSEFNSYIKVYLYLFIASLVTIRIQSQKFIQTIINYINIFPKKSLYLSIFYLGTDYSLRIKGCYACKYDDNLLEGPPSSQSFANP